MQITIPPNTDLTDKPFAPALFTWLEANGISTATVNGLQPVIIADDEIVYATLNESGPTNQPITVPMDDYLSSALINEFAIAVAAGRRMTDAEVEQALGGPSGSTDLDDMAQLVTQLTDARTREKDAKAEAEEARDQILARMRERNAKIGNVGGRPAVLVKTITSTRFKTVDFRKNYPDLADQYTGTSESTRLEIL